MHGRATIVGQVRGWKVAILLVEESQRNCNASQLHSTAVLLAYSPQTCCSPKHNGNCNGKDKKRLECA